MSSWTVPAGVEEIHVIVVAGGGGGGGGYFNDDRRWYYGGGGGGSGGRHCAVIRDLTPGSSIAISIGRGGAGGMAGSSGTATSFHGFTATGGAGGGTASSGGGGSGGSGGGAAGLALCGTSANGAVGSTGGQNYSSTGGYVASWGFFHFPSTNWSPPRVSSGGPGGGSNAPLSCNATTSPGSGGEGGKGNGAVAGCDGSHGAVIIRTSAITVAPGLTPTFDTPVRTDDGFTVNVTNYDPSFGWAPSQNAGQVSVGAADGATLPITVTGLTAGQSALITMTTSKAGFSDAAQSVAGQARSTQSVTWAPTRTITTAQSPLTPSEPASGLGSPTIQYSVLPGFTTSSCSVDAVTGELTYAGTGDCTVRATALATADYLQGSTDVMFTVSKAAQTVTWVPTTAITTVQSPLTPSVPASGLGSPTIQYSVLPGFTTSSCAVDAVTGQLTYAGIGDCTVRATALATDDYEQGSTDVMFTVSKAAQTVTWSPPATVSLAALSVNATDASTSGDGALRYSVVDAGTTGCAITDPTIPEVTYASAGSCIVRATADETSTYLAGSLTHSITVGLATPTMSWSPVTSLLTSSSTATPTPASTTGDGVIRYVVTDPGTTACTWDDATGTLSYAAVGSCTVTASTLATSRFAAGSVSVTFTVADPPPPPPFIPPPFVPPVAPPVLPPAPNPNPSPTPDPSPSPSPEPNPDPTPGPAPDPSPNPNPGPSQDPTQDPNTDAFPARTIKTVEGVRVPVSGGAPTGLPPRPERVTLGVQTRKIVRVTLPRETAGTRIWATVVTVTDPQGDLVARIVVRARPGERRAQVTVPFFAPGYSVRVYTVNALGVSRGGFATSPLIRTSTLAPRSQRTAALLGTRLGRPVYFAGGSATLDATDRRQLALIARSAKASKSPVFVTGFARKGANTDSVLTRLSTQRARAVAEYLASRGVRVWIRYWGAGGLGGDGTARDRRVEVRTLDRQPQRLRAAAVSLPSAPHDLGP